MLGAFNKNGPLFIQIKERIESQIMQGILSEEEQIPSITQIVKFYKVNHITVAKGINLLVDEGIIYKKRGVGMFVTTGAQEQLLVTRRLNFAKKFVIPLIAEAHNLNMQNKEIIEIVKEELNK